MKKLSRRESAARCGMRDLLAGRWMAAAAAAGYAASWATAAEAYVGPGAGMGVLGVILAVAAAILMALVGLVLWPIRMVAHRRKAKAQNAAVERKTAEAGGQQAPRESAQH